MTTDVLLFLAVVFGAVALGWWIIFRQANWMGRHHCPHTPAIGQVHVQEVDCGCDSYAKLRVVEFGSKTRGPVYDIDLGLHVGEQQ